MLLPGSMPPPGWNGRTCIGSRRPMEYSARRACTMSTMFAICGPGQVLQAAPEDVSVLEAVVREVERIGSVTLRAGDVRLDAGRIDLPVGLTPRRHSARGGVGDVRRGQDGPGLADLGLDDGGLGQEGEDAAQVVVIEPRRS